MKKIIISSLLFVTSIFQAQTNTENYIQNRVYLEPTATTNTSIKQVQTVTYFDGLGRSMQEVAVKASPTGKDIVSFFEYDDLGRRTKDYFPIPQKGTQSGNIYPTHLNNKTDVYGSEKIYSENVVENSPLKRIQQQLLPGNDWSAKSTAFGYDVNTAGEVKKYNISTSWTEGRTESSLSQSGNYSPGTLYKSSIVDEDGNKSEVFKDKKGQTILVRKNTGTESIDTYYIYNEYGQLVYTLPPLAVQAAINTSTLDNLCYQYRYDNWGRLVEKKLPGKDWEYMVYDKQNRLVATQDANLKEKGQWLYTKYDKFGRIAYTGINTGGTRSQEQTEANTFGSNNVDRGNSVFFNRQGMDVYYGSSDLTYPKSPTWVTLLSLNYYDTYPGYSFSPVVPQSIQGEEVLKDTPKNGMSTKGLPVISLTKNIEDDNWTKSYIYYDFKGRVIGGHSTNHLGGYTRTETALDFAGMAKQSKTYHKRLESDVEKVITQTFTYDAQNRLLLHKHQVDNNPEEILSQNEYNELSQLKNKKVGGTNITQPLQSIDYTYNIRGWLTKINDPSDLNGKLFGYAIKYASPVNPNVAPGKFNGTITEVDWKNASEDVLKRYDYSYDTTGRLQNAIYSEPNSANPFNNYYNENLTYDLNGNIKTLKRNAFPVTGNTATLVDDLVYQYTGNRLDKVLENALNDTGYEGGNNPVSYDLNGNMTNMLDKNIQSIAYNYLNLSNEFWIKQTNSTGQFTTTSISYLYSADGEKLRKTYFSSPPRGSGTTRMTDYLDGFQYNYVDKGSVCLTCRTESAYEEQAYKAGLGPVIPGIPTWKLDFVSTAQGFYSFTENRYIYQYNDHLGNTRVSFAKNSAGAPEITDTNNYYPFGLNHTGGNGINNSKFGGLYSYKYNGKELQETGLFDYGWRQYMPDLGRWNGLDQLAESYHSTSPYAYVANNPVSLTDPDGRWIDDSGHIVDTSGQTYGFLGSSTKPKQATNYLGTGLGEGGGSNYTPFGQTQAYADIMTAFGNGKTGDATIQNGSLSWRTSNGSDGVIELPEVVLSGTSSLLFGLQLRNHVNAYMKEWNAQSNLDWKRRTCGHCFDGPIKYMGGPGDPFGFFEGIGMAISGSDNSGMKLAALPLLVLTKNGDDALKLLAVEKSILKEEAKAISKNAVAKNGTLNAGPFAGEGLVAKNGKSRNFTVDERKIINEQGYSLGCHTCGQTSPGTKSGNFILDHQPANALIPSGWPQTFYPHCRFCSSSQGGIIGGMKKQGILPKISN